MVFTIYYSLQGDRSYIKKYTLLYNIKCLSIQIIITVVINGF